MNIHSTSGYHFDSFLDCPQWDDLSECNAAWSHSIWKHQGTFWLSSLLLWPWRQTAVSYRPIWKPLHIPSAVYPNPKIGALVSVMGVKAKMLGSALKKSQVTNARQKQPSQEMRTVGKQAFYWILAYVWSLTMVRSLRVRCFALLSFNQPMGHNSPTDSNNGALFLPLSTLLGHYFFHWYYWWGTISVNGSSDGDTISPNDTNNGAPFLLLTPNTGLYSSHWHQWCATIQWHQWWGPFGLKVRCHPFLSFNQPMAHNYPHWLQQ